jgi:hypothetical protein
MGCRPKACRPPTASASEGVAIAGASLAASRSIALQAGFTCNAISVPVRPAEFTLRLRRDGSLLVRHRYDELFWSDGRLSASGPHDDYPCPDPVGSLVVTAGLYFGWENGLWGGARRVHHPRGRRATSQRTRRWQTHQVIVDRDRVKDFLAGVFTSDYPWSLRASAGGNVRFLQKLAKLTL